MKRYKCGENREKEPALYSKNDMWEGRAPEGVYRSDGTSSGIRCVVLKTYGSEDRAVLRVSNNEVEGASRADAKQWELTDEKFCCDFIGG